MEFLEKWQKLIDKYRFNLLFSVLMSGLFILCDFIFLKYNTYYKFTISWLSLVEFIILFVMMMILSFLKKKNSIIMILLLIFLTTFSQFTYFQFFGKYIGGIDFYFFFVNNGEVSEALKSLFSMMFVPFTISFVGFLLSLFILNICFKKRIYFKKTYIFIIFCLIISFCYGFFLAHIKNGKLYDVEAKLMIYPLNYRVAWRNYYVSFNYFMSDILPDKMFHLRKSKFPKLKKPVLSNKNIHRDIYFVIGESLRYKTFELNSIYTPKLSTLQNTEDFFYFAKAYPGGTMTKVSLATLLNRLKDPSSLEQLGKGDDCLFKLAKENNIETYFYSAQTKQQIQIINNFICPKYIDDFKTKADFINTGYDEDLITALQKIKISDKSRLYVLHKRGAHYPYNYYPKEMYNKNLSDYENCAVYIDDVLYRLAKEIKKRSNKEFIMIYVSDHGELLGKDGHNGHGFLEKEVYEVPFFVYSNTKDEKLKEELKSLKTHFDISNMITSLMGYDVEKEDKNNRRIYIMNSDLEGFSGYGILDIKDGKEGKVKIFKRLE